MVRAVTGHGPMLQGRCKNDAFILEESKKMLLKATYDLDLES